MDSSLRDVLRARLDVGKLKTAVNVSTVLGMKLKDAFVAKGKDVLYEGYGEVTTIETLAEMRGYARHVVTGGDKRHRLSALPGLGKSTYFPMMLAKAAGRTVVVLEHSEALAAMVRAGAEAMKSEGTRTLVKDIPTSYSGMDVLEHVGDGTEPQVVYAPLRAFMDGIIVANMPPVYVIHDESHFSDYVTYTWRHICAEMTWVIKHVQMSATLDENVITDVANKRNPGGVDRLLVDTNTGRVAEWSVDDTTGEAMSPWAGVNLASQNTVVFSDDLRANAKYARELRAVGVAAHCLDARSTKDDVLSVFTEMETVERGVTVFVDSTYRSGYTFFADAVIETGMVRETYCDAHGRLHERYRVAYVSEMYQAVARVGRVRRGVAYVNALDYAVGVNSLAVGETRHACALTRLMGYVPDEVLLKMHPSAERWSRRYCLRVLGADGTPDTDECSDDEGHVGTGRTEQGSADGPTSIAAAMGSASRGFAEAVDVGVVFGTYTPATRYSVPSAYKREPRPFWVHRDGYRVVLASALADPSHTVNPSMFSRGEVQWFAASLVEDWNGLCDVIVSDAILVKVALDLHSARRLHSAHVDEMRRRQGKMSLDVRRLEELRELLKGLYEAKPFDISRTDLSGDQGVSAEYQRALIALSPTAHPQYAQVGFVPRRTMRYEELTYVHHSEDAGSLVSTTSPPRLGLGGIGAYTWHAPSGSGSREDRYRAASDRGSFARSVGAGSGGSSGTRSSARRAE